MRGIPILIILLSLIISLMGCSSNVQGSMKDYKNSDVAAIVGDKEITIGDLRFLYSDDDVLNNIEGIVKFELMLQEAKKMNLDISEDKAVRKEIMLSLPLEEGEVRMQEFITSQADKLGMEKEEYYKKYAEIRSEQDSYVNAYIQEMVGADGYDEENLKEFDKKANDFLNDLVKKHEKEIKILIK
ncbi:hypothetical protein NCCP2222_06230 [Sporosarcina sp. NCCP-2222]|uniref:hypothetical protein n=1 Tax=Sporosarcina sp. NCCP-2222 TaxID=2935073 RepID=UPI00208D6AAD|nr:hypothetical protein [Sporosarcina sp. NCCP-2222]GKV54676.1 hypothetical protein NCCP2222_06230 [Sporosarcina sp. NCCP-2222]